MKEVFVEACNPYFKQHLLKNSKGSRPLLLSTEEIFNSLSKKNKNHINEFVEFKTNQGRSSTRLKTMRMHLIKFAYSLEKDFDKANSKDMNGMNGLIHRSKMKIPSKQDQIIDVRQFYKWLLGNNKHFPEIVETS